MVTTSPPKVVTGWKYGRGDSRDQGHCPPRVGGGYRGTRVPAQCRQDLAELPGVPATGALALITVDAATVDAVAVDAVAGGAPGGADVVVAGGGGNPPVGVG